MKSLGRLPLGVQWTFATLTGWTTAFAINRLTGLPPIFGGLAAIQMGSLFIDSGFGSSRQYKIPVQSVVSPRFDAVIYPLIVLGVGMLLLFVLLTLVGCAQWLVIRTRLRVSIRWVFATALAMMFAEGLFHFSSFFPFFEVIILAGLLGGMIVGVGQWLILRRHIRGASRWVLFVLLAWTLGAIAYLLPPFPSLSGLSANGTDFNSWLAEIDAQAGARALIAALLRATVIAVVTGVGIQRIVGASDSLQG